MNTISVLHEGVGFIAHRGASALERENTAAAFVAAGNRSYFGIETDVHRTADGRFILIHDDTTTRVTGGVNLTVEKSSFDDLRQLKLVDIGGGVRWDLVLPTPEEYFSICRKYDKTAVFELKNPFTEEEIEQIIALVRKSGWLHRTVFISFSFFNVKTLRKLLPEAKIQYLYEDRITAEFAAMLADEKLDLDVRHDRLNPETVALLKEKGITINCWTVDDPERAAALVAMGVDYITTNRLE